MNSLGRDIEDGEYVILKESAMAEGYRDITWRVFQARGGFGMRRDTIGTAVMGTFVRDGEDARMEGYHVERVATPDEVAAATTAR
jgi:hypothetical protein